MKLDSLTSNLIYAIAFKDGFKRKLSAILQTFTYNLLAFLVSVFKLCVSLYLQYVYVNGHIILRYLERIITILYFKFWTLLVEHQLINVGNGL